MSKKMMKRSLALGALMAFVITGSAMAAEFNGGTYTIDEVIKAESSLHGGVVSTYAKHHEQSVLLTDKSNTFNGAVFRDNNAENTIGECNGGVVYNTETLVLNDCDFINNSLKSFSGKARGGVISNGGTMTINGCLFDGNSVSHNTDKNDQYGSVIHSTGEVTIVGSTFKESTGGRVVYIADGIANLKDNVFDGNARGCVQTDDGNKSVVNFEGTNTFINNQGTTLKNKYEMNFLEDSVSIFSGNANDMENTGTVNIQNNGYVEFNSYVEKGGKINLNNGTLVLATEATTTIDELGGTGGNIKVGMATENTISQVQINAFADGADESKFVVGATGAVTDYIAELSGDAQTAAMESVFASVTDGNGEELAGDIVTTDEGLLAGAYTITRDGDVITSTQAVNTKQDAVSDAGMTLKGHWRAHMNDMNKRMGELRNANGEAGVWTRMVRGESEYQGAKMQYNQYQLGYDEKLSVDKRWTVGAAVTFSEGDASYGTGSTEDKSTAFAIYGSKLNNDGTFVDLIARYARIESDLDDRNYGTGDYDANGYSVSAEFGKRIQQGNGLWIEPQVELTYGSVDGAKVNFSKNFTANYDSMDSFVARAGFALGKDIKQGNVYARASYLYDFDGETETQFEGGKAISEDFGGGWWEVGVGANINLSKATYIYADVEKTFGGEVDTNWQWNLGVRYSF